MNDRVGQEDDFYVDVAEPIAYKLLDLARFTDPAGTAASGSAASTASRDSTMASRPPSKSSAEKKFLAEAEANGLCTLKGHRSVGGMRASIYNAMPVEGVQALRDFMRDFRAKNAD